MGVVPMDWRGACIVPLYKGKGDHLNGCSVTNTLDINIIMGMTQINRNACQGKS